MIQRILNLLRSLAVLSAFTLALRRAVVKARQPEPVRGPAVPGEASDTWLFDGERTNLASGVYMLEEQYARVSGALSSLRGVLSSLTRLPAGAQAAYEVPCDAPLPVDPALFDEAPAPIAVLTNVVAFEDDDLFAEYTFALPRIPAHQDTLARVA
jgi:hypothetical protein